MIKNNKKKRNKLFTTIIECSLFLLIIYLFVSNLSKNNIFKGGGIIDVENEIYTSIKEGPNDEPELGRELFRRPYVGDKRRCFRYISPISEGPDQMVRGLDPPQTLTWGHFSESFDIERNPQRVEEVEKYFQWLELNDKEDGELKYINAD